MRCFDRIKCLVLASVAVALLALGGCSPGNIVWRLGDDHCAAASPVLPVDTEANR